jgi:hypothetical protein
MAAAAGICAALSFLPAVKKANCGRQNRKEIEMVTIGDWNDLNEVCDADTVADEVIAVLKKANLTVNQGKKMLEWARVRLGKVMISLPLDSRVQ